MTSDESFSPNGCDKDPRVGAQFESTRLSDNTAMASSRYVANRHIPNQDVNFA
jgi:hypothetical protein